MLRLRNVYCNEEQVRKEIKTKKRQQEEINIRYELVALCLTLDDTLVYHQIRLMDRHDLSNGFFRQKAPNAAGGYSRFLPFLELFEKS